MQLVEELLTFWSLEDYEDSLEELEEALIVSEAERGWRYVISQGAGLVVPGDTCCISATGLVS